MASLQASTILLSSSSSSPRYSSKRINAAISIPKLPRVGFSAPKVPTRDLIEELNTRNGVTDTTPLQKNNSNSSASSMATEQLFAILEAVADRVEMHKNIGEQRQNWNNLLLNSINMITLTAATMTGIAANSGAGGSILALKLASTLLFSAATGMLVIMNKIQPSQLAEEQRKATRTFKQLQSQIETLLALGDPTQDDVKESMEKVLALDKAYPLPLLGVMLEKFPKSFEPAVWWPQTNHLQRQRKEKQGQKINGWSEELEMEMREVLEVVKRKDKKEYKRLGNLVLKVHKMLALSGPLLTGIAAAGSTLVGTCSWAAMVALVAGSLASAVNSLEHGGQVGMVFELYRNSAGFFNLLEESIESTINESEVKDRENGEVFEMKVALQLGRSSSQLRDLAKKSNYSRVQGTEVDEFASKLF